MQGDMYGLDIGQLSVPELGMLPGDRSESSEEKGRVAAREQAWRNLYNSINLCQLMNPPAELVLTALNSVTGWGLVMDDLMTMGKRIVTLKRLLNLRRGLTRANDRLPDLLLKPFESGGSAGIVPDVRLLLSGAYAEYGWDPQTGMPTQQTLKELGLEFAAKAL
jgi:aldehyde:ferredoxin oxidoreductase